MTDDFKYLTEREAAQILKISMGALKTRRMRGNNRPPWSKLGRSIRYKLSDIESHLERKEIISRGEMEINILANLDGVLVKITNPANNQGPIVVTSKGSSIGEPDVGSAILSALNLALNKAGVTT